MDLMEQTLEFRVSAARPFLSSPKEGDRLALVLPDRRIKEDPRTLIWAAPLGDREKAVFKVYIHRGAAAHICASFWPLCVQLEYEALLCLEENGIPCTEPLLWGMGRSSRYGRIDVLATREIPGARSMRDGFRRQGMQISQGLLMELARHGRRMHGCGVYHGAFSWKNVLVTGPSGEGSQIHIADMARSFRFPGDIAGSRMARFDILHFCYHVARLMGRDTCLRFLLEYGFDARTAEEVLAVLPGYDPERRLPRELRRLEFQIQSTLSRLRGGARHGPAGNNGSCT